MSADLIEALRKDARLRKDLSRLVASEIIADPEIRLLVVEKVIADVATKSDLRGEVEALKSEIEKSSQTLREEIEKSNQALREEIEKSNQTLREEIDRSNQTLREEIEKSNQALRREIDLLGRRIDDLQKVTLSSLVAIVLTLATVIITRVL